MRALARQLALAMLTILMAQGAAAQGLPEPLTSEPGNPGRGKLIVRDLDRASCLICHVMPIPEEPDHGNIGPSLVGIGARMTEAELRQRIVDPRSANPDTIMPGYFRLDGLRDVHAPYLGRTIYTAQEVEDVLAYLLSLTDEAAAP